jgi:tRNA-uridine 2-sulfurtransferase
MTEMTFSNTLADGSENCSENYDNNKGECIDNKDNANKKKIKAVALLSGGLDSNLAVRMIKEQNIEVEAVAIKTPFCDFDCGKGCGHKVMEVSSELGINLKTIYLGKEYLTMLKNPKHGYGSGMNPCIDCRMMMYDEAQKHMKKIGADFLITGEVLHQRPMSQNSNALSVIEKETGMEGRVLRPLSAQLLPKTEPEKKGHVKRSMLGSIQGRSRKDQLKLANKFGIADPPNSAGGCLLTDPQFAKRIRDLMTYSISEPSINDVELLKLGRHFRFNNHSKLIVGRNHNENESLLTLVLNSDYLITTIEIPGPVSILRISGKPDLRKHKKLLLTSLGIALRYSDVLPEKSCKVQVTNKLNKTNIIFSSLPYSITEVEKYRI